MLVSQSLVLVLFAGVMYSVLLTKLKLGPHHTIETPCTTDDCSKYSSKPFIHRLCLCIEQLYLAVPLQPMTGRLSWGYFLYSFVVSPLHSLVLYNGFDICGVGVSCESDFGLTPHKNTCAKLRRNFPSKSIRGIARAFFA